VHAKFVGNVEDRLGDVGIRWEGVVWIELAHSGVHWWAFVITVMNLRVP
jgi:hypothetical protein